MRNRFAVLVLCATIAAPSGCNSDDDKTFTNNTTNNNDNNEGNLPTNPNDGSGPGAFDGTKDNTINVSAQTDSSGGQSTVVFTASLIGLDFDPNDPTKNGTKPPPNYRFAVTFTYNLPQANPGDPLTRAQPVVVELSTFNPSRLTGNAGGPRPIHGTNPDVRMSVRVIDGIPPARGTAVEDLILDEAIPTSSTGARYSKGFDNPTTPPQTIP